MFSGIKEVNDIPYSSTSSAKVNRNSFLFCLIKKVEPSCVKTNLMGRFNNRFFSPNAIIHPRLKYTTKIAERLIGIALNFRD